MIRVIVENNRGNMGLALTKDNCNLIVNNGSFSLRIVWFHCKPHLYNDSEKYFNLQEIGNDMYCIVNVHYMEKFLK